MGGHAWTWVEKSGQGWTQVYMDGHRQTEGGQGCSTLNHLCQVVISASFTTFENVDLQTPF